MNTKIDFVILLGICSLYLSGCVQESKQIEPVSDEHAVYTPMKVPEVPPTVKHESVIDHQKEIEKYEKEQAQMSDFNKYMRSRDIKLRNK